MSNPSITLGPTSGSREIQMHTDALVRLDGPVEALPSIDPANTGRMCQTFEPETGDDITWRPTVAFALAILLVWVWIVFEAYQMVRRAPGLFE